MRIVYVGAFRLPRYDAAAARVLNIGKPLAELGHEVIFLSWGGKYDDHEIVEGKFHQIGGMKYMITGEIDPHGLKNKIVSKLTRGNLSKSIIKELKPDVVITYNTHYGFNKYLLRLSKKQNFKLVADITEWYDNNELSLVDVIPNWLNMTRTYKRFPNKIVISSYLDRYYKESNNIVIPALCDSRDMKWVTKSKRSDKTLRLIYAGNPAKKDNVHTVIKVVDRLAKENYDILFDIVGIDRETYLKRYGNPVEGELSERIVFNGKVNQDLIPQYYADADFMVLLRDNNRKSNAGFPTKFAEAMMSGTPVIANATSDISKYLSSGENGILLTDTSENTLYTILKHQCGNTSISNKKELKANAAITGKEIFDCMRHQNSLNDFIYNLI